MPTKNKNDRISYARSGTALALALLCLGSCLIFGCSPGERGNAADPPPALGEAAGQKVLGNGEMLLLFGERRDSSKADPSFHSFFIGDYSRIIIEEFSLEPQISRSSAGETFFTSQPASAAYYSRRSGDLLYIQQAAVPVNDNALIVRGKVINSGRGTQTLIIQPRFSFTRPVIFDQYKDRSNIYIDEFTFCSGFIGQTLDREKRTIDSPLTLHVRAGSEESFTFLLTMDREAVDAALAFRTLSGDSDPFASAENSWTEWLASGTRPHFSDSSFRKLYDVNLITLKALNLNGQLPTGYLGAEPTEGLPFLSPRASFSSASAFLEAGYPKETEKIFNYWKNRPLKQDGEWFASYNAYGDPARQGTDSPFAVREWDSNGYYSTLMRRYRQLQGRNAGDLDFLRSLLQFIDGRIHSNGLLYEGGLVEDEGYIASSAMSIAAACFQASELTDRLQRRLEADSYRRTAQRLRRGLEYLFSTESAAYMDYRDAEHFPNPSFLFGWCWGWPDHRELQLSAEYYYQHLNPDSISGPSLTAQGTGLSIPLSSAYIRYFSARGYDVRVRKLLQQLQQRATVFGGFSEYSEPRSDAAPIPAVEAAFNSWQTAEYVLALRDAAVYGILSDVSEPALRELRTLSAYHFSDSSAVFKNPSILDSLAGDDPAQHFDRQKMQNLLRILKPEESFHLQPLPYPEELDTGTGFEYHFSGDPAGGASLSERSLLQMSRFDSVGNSLHLEFRKIDLSKDRFAADLLRIYSRDSTQSVLLPVHVLQKAPWTMDLSSVYCVDTVGVRFSNRSRSPLRVLPPFASDSAAVDIGPKTQKQLRISIPEDLDPGLTDLHFRIITETDTLTQSLSIIRSRALDLGGIWYLQPVSFSHPLSIDALLADSSDHEKSQVPAQQGFSPRIPGSGALNVYRFFRLPREGRGRSLSLQIRGLDDSDAIWLNGRLLSAEAGEDMLQIISLDDIPLYWNRENLLQIRFGTADKQGLRIREPFRILYY